MTEINNFKTEILKQLKSEWMSKIRIGQHELVQIQDKLTNVIEQSKDLALKPGQLPAEWGEPETKKFRPKVIMDEMLFANQVIAYVDVKLEECKLNAQRKDPTTLAQLYQRMDHTRMTLFALCPKQADLLLKRIKSAISAFAQVSVKKPLGMTKMSLIRMTWTMMNRFQIWLISLEKPKVLQKSPARGRKRNQNLR